MRDLNQRPSTKLASDLPSELLDGRCDKISRVQKLVILTLPAGFRRIYVSFSPLIRMIITVTGSKILSSTYHNTNNYLLVITSDNKAIKPWTVPTYIVMPQNLTGCCEIGGFRSMIVGDFNYFHFFSIVVLKLLVLYYI